MNSNDNLDIPLLNRAQQLLFQKLLVHKVLKEGELASLWSNLLSTPFVLDDNDHQNHDLHQTLSIINKSIKPAFGLEIRSVSLALKIPNDDDHDDDDNEKEEHLKDSDEDSDEERNHNNNNTATATSSIPNEMYYTIVNIHPDEHAKKHSCIHFAKHPHELALFHLILQRLIDATPSEYDSTKMRRFGLGSSLSRMEIINLRTELSDSHEGKVSLGEAETMMYWLEEQGWLVPAPRDNKDGSTSNSSSSSDYKKKHNEGDGKRRGRKRSSTSGHGSRLQLGPRSYLEFPDFLVKAGMEQDGLPQFILY